MQMALQEKDVHRLRGVLRKWLQKVALEPEC
jgi:hypothetical protein